MASQIDRRGGDRMIDRDEQLRPFFFATYHCIEHNINVKYGRKCIKCENIKRIAKEATK